MRTPEVGEVGEDCVEGALGRPVPMTAVPQTESFLTPSGYFPQHDVRYGEGSRIVLESDLGL